MSGTKMLDGLLRATAVCTWLTLAILSLVPGQDRPHTGFSGDVEHAVAYFGAALITRLALGGVRSRWQVLAFSAASAAFEVAQAFIPGRHAGIDNWAASSAGAAAGILLGRSFDHWLATRGLLPVGSGGATRRAGRRVRG